MATYIVSASGGDYTTLEAGVEAVGTANGDIFNIQGIWTSAENTQITVGENITINAISESKHPGREWATGDTHWRHRYATTSTGHSFIIGNVGYLTMNGLDIQRVAGGVSAECLRLNDVGNASTISLDSCVMGHSGMTIEQDVLYGQDLATNISLTNCMFYHTHRGVVDQFGSVQSNFKVDVNSCTVYSVGTNSAPRNGLVGVDASTNMRVRCFNTLVETLASQPFIFPDSSATIDVANSATDQGSWGNNAIDIDINNRLGATFQTTTGSINYILRDLTSNPYDLRLVSSSFNLAQDSHSDATGAGLTMPSVDIIGNPRVAPYCQGAWEVTASAGGAPPAGEPRVAGIRFERNSSYSYGDIITY